MKLPHWVFSISPFLSFFLSFVLVPFWCVPSLIWLWRREAIENLVERVFMVDGVVRWLSQRRMLIRQPRLRLIWLAAVTPPSCSQSVPHLFPPLHCSTASFLSLQMFFLVIPFYIQDHPLWACLCYKQRHNTVLFPFYQLKKIYSQCQEIWGPRHSIMTDASYTLCVLFFYLRTMYNVTECNVPQLLSAGGRSYRASKASSM